MAEAHVANHDQKPDPRKTKPDPHWNQQFWVTVGLLVALGAASLWLMVTANAGDTVWQHRTYVFAAVEAITFTAVGWLFGKEVHRGEAETAKADAAESKSDANTANARLLTEVAATTRTSTKMMALGVAINHAFAETTRRGGGGGPVADAVAGSRTPPESDAIAMLKGLADGLLADET
jgi:hypothetical protein